MSNCLRNLSAPAVLLVAVAVASSVASADSFTLKTRDVVFCTYGTAVCDAKTPTAEVIGVVQFHNDLPYGAPTVIDTSEVAAFLAQTALAPPPETVYLDASGNGTGTYHGEMFQFGSNDPVSTPEPSTLALLLCGLAGMGLMLAGRRRSTLIA